jgi:glycosyltransferase
VVAVRVLMLTTPVPTHFMPMVPLAWALRAGGHDVLVACQPDVAGAVAGAGLNAVLLGEPFLVDEMLRAKLRDGQRPVAANPRPPAESMGNYGRVWIEHTRRLLPEYLDLARSYRPDLLVADQMEYSALIVGGLLGVPAVHHRWGVDPISGQARLLARTELAELCRATGLAALPEPTRLLDPCPPELQLPEAEPGTPIRFVPFNGNGPLPDWLGARSPGRPRAAKRVVVSLGSRTLLLNGIPLLRNLLRILGGFPDTEVLVTAERGHRAEIGSLPANTRVVDPVPLTLLLGDCDAVVHHGGAGTAMTATAHGLPQLVLPQLADQFAIGDRLAASGAGISLDDAAAQDDPRRLREALDAVVRDPSLARAAEGLRQSVAAMPSPAQVAADLGRLLEEHSPQAKELSHAPCR